jgi:predicted GNAT family N-acyltransferase
MPAIEVQRITSAEQMAAALDIRRRVFIAEQRVPEEEEIDAHDGDPGGVTTAVHVLATLDGEPVGTARLLLDGADHGDGGPGYPHVGRVAVLAEHRRKHVGDALMQALHEEAKARGYAGITLGAQLHAIPFYEQLDYVARGGIFLDAGIEHRWMDHTFE